MKFEIQYEKLNQIIKMFVLLTSILIQVTPIIFYHASNYAYFS